MIENEHRITRLEVQIELLSAQLKDNSAKLDALLMAVNMGKGAGWLIIRIGFVMVGVSGLVAWGVDHIPFLKGH